MGVTPALLVVQRGKLIRMIIIGAIELPLFLSSGTLIAPFVTETAKKVGAFPAGLNNNTLKQFHILPWKGQWKNS